MLRDAAAEVARLFSETPAISANAVEEHFRAMAEQRSVKIGAIAQGLRVSLTGRTATVGIFEIVHLLGPDEVATRISTALETIPA